MNVNQKRRMEMWRKSSASLVLALIISSGLFFAAPSSAHAAGVGTIACGTSLFGSSASALSSKVPVADSQVESNSSAMKNVQCTWNGIAWQLAKTALHSLTGSVVNWINSGFNGSPSFLTNPGGYFTDLADQATGEFISDTGVLSALCSPFNIDVRLALALNQSNGYGGRYTCTLSSIINNVQNSTVNGMSINGFMNGDFSQGGWPAFIAIGEPSNNEAGVYLQAQSDLAERISGKQASVDKQLTQGNGFLSWQSCTTVNPAQAQAMAGIAPGSQLQTASQSLANDLNYNGSGGYVGSTLLNQTTGQSSAATQPMNALDLENAGIQTSVDASGNVNYQSCQTQTPGSVINSSLEKVLGSSVDELGLTNDINEIVSALFSQLLIKTLSGGLSGASQSTSGSSNLGSITNQLIQDQDGQANAAALQGQAAGEVQQTANTAQQAVTYRSQIVTALTGELSLYQTTSACIANELGVVTSSYNYQNNYSNSPTFGQQQQQPLTPNYLQSELTSINTAIAGIAQQISDAQTNLATASSSVVLYQNAADQIGGASSLNQAVDASNQVSSQLSTIPYNAAADPASAQTDLNSTVAGITVLETARKPYETVCNGQMPASQ